MTVAKTAIAWVQEYGGSESMGSVSMSKGSATVAAASVAAAAAAAICAKRLWGWDGYESTSVSERCKRARDPIFALIFPTLYSLLSDSQSLECLTSR